MPKSLKLPASYYQKDDVVSLSKDLIGKVLVSKIGGKLTSGLIVETEAYDGRNDRACHAYGGRMTSRTRVMYESGGRAYVYLCYGIHHLFNIITNKEGLADAILIRALEPVDGIPGMLRRRGMEELAPRICAGPGCVSRALGISTQAHNRLDLTGDQVWIEDRGIEVASNRIIASPRVGIDYAGEDALLPWRFRLASDNGKPSRYASKAK